MSFLIVFGSVLCFGSLLLFIPSSLEPLEQWRWNPHGLLIVYMFAGGLLSALASVFRASKRSRATVNLL